MAMNKRITRYKLLKSRIKASKKEIVLYQFALENRRKSFWAKEIVDMFGYSESAKFGYPTIMSSRLGKYIELLPKRKRQDRRYLIFLDLIWVPKETLEGRTITPIRSTTKHGYYLIPRIQAPWWLLAEYGGHLNERSMIDNEKALINKWQQEINDLKLKGRS
jgi:hypothetical protein